MSGGSTQSDSAHDVGSLSPVSQFLFGLSCPEKESRRKKQLRPTGAWVVEPTSMPCGLAVSFRDMDANNGCANLHQAMLGVDCPESLWLNASFPAASTCLGLGFVRTCMFCSGRPLPFGGLSFESGTFSRRLWRKANGGDEYLRLGLKKLWSIDLGTKGS